MSNQTFKPSKKHLAIFQKIIEKGYYRPRYSDHEPATKTLINRNIVQWRQDYRGVRFTEYGKEFVQQYITPEKDLAERASKFI